MIDLERLAMLLHVRELLTKHPDLSGFVPHVQAQLKELHADAVENPPLPPQPAEPEPGPTGPEPTQPANDNIARRLPNGS